MLHATKGAIVILHEIYGINAHIRRIRDIWQARGFDVFIPALFPHDTPFSYAQQEEAYRHFMRHTGFETTPVITLLNRLKIHYPMVLVVGYSVGATLAWLAARSGQCDGVICHYGSRIRQYSDIAPTCPALMIIARHESGFDTGIMQRKLNKFPSVQSYMFDARHGFCDADCSEFDDNLAQQAHDKVWDFIKRIIHR